LSFKPIPVEKKIEAASKAILPTYRAITGYFSGCLHQLCTNHARRIISRIIKNLPLEAKKDKFWYNIVNKIYVLSQDI